MRVLDADHILRSSVCSSAAIAMDGGGASLTGEARWVVGRHSRLVYEFAAVGDCEGFAYDVAFGAEEAREDAVVIVIDLGVIDL